MMDLNGKHVELSIRADGKVVWLNIGNICAVRINNPLSIHICDAREPPNTELTEREQLIERKRREEPCRYCGGTCPKQPADSPDLCDGYAGDIDGLYESDSA